VLLAIKDYQCKRAMAKAPLTYKISALGHTHIRQNRVAAVTVTSLNFSFNKF